MFLIIMENKFQIYKKWFWVGVAIALVNFLAGWIYAFALYAEKEHRKEGTVLILWSSLVAAFYIFVLIPFLQRQGIVPSL